MKISKPKLKSKDPRAGFKANTSKEKPKDEFKAFKRKSRLKMAGVTAGGAVIFLAVLSLITVSSVPESTEVELEGLNDNVSMTRQLEFGMGTYVGDTEHGNMNGQGTFEFDTGEKYEGEWDVNQMSGEGSYEYSNGVYEGDFKDSAREGSGTFKWEDGTLYEGAWADDELSGAGVLTTKKGDVFDGTFSENSFQSGNLKLKTKKDTYTIKYSSGSPSTIKANFDNGDRYNGDFSMEDSTIKGEGKMTFKGVGTYEGSFYNGTRSGQGKFTWTDGTYYEGEWRKDKMSGEGEYHFSEDEYLEGTFKNNQPVKTCTFYKDGDSYTTKWKDGKCTSIEED